MTEPTPELRDMVARTLALAAVAEEKHASTGREEWRCIAKAFRFLAEEVAGLQPRATPPSDPRPNS